MNSNDFEIIHLTAGLKFSRDYSLCHHNTDEFVFNKKQAKVLSLLSEHYMSTGFSMMHCDMILRHIYPTPYGRKLRDIFKTFRNGKNSMHPAWGKIIGPGLVRGVVRLIPVSPVKDP